MDPFSHPGQADSSCLPDTETTAIIFHFQHDARIAALKNLKDLLDSGVLTQAEFDAQKQKLLNG